MKTPKMITDLGRLYPTETSKEKKHFAIYECPDCKTEFRCQVGDIKNKHTVSCGCFRQKTTADKNFKHGLSGTRIHSEWLTMKKRCKYEAGQFYEYYGGKGIVVCADWDKNFLSFYNWSMTNGYVDTLYIDRINTLGNYTPNNCRWSTKLVSGQNTGLLCKKNKSGYRDVKQTKNKKRWEAQISNDNDKEYLGTYDTRELAAQAYNDYVIKNKTAHPLNIIPNSITP